MRIRLDKVACAYCTNRATTVEHDGDAMVPICKAHRLPTDQEPTP